MRCLNAGLLEELHIDIAAGLLAAGIRLSDQRESTPAHLGNPTGIAGHGVTHRRHPVPCP